MDGRYKRKIESDTAGPSGKRIKLVMDESKKVSPTLVKFGNLRVHTLVSWQDAQVKLYSNAELEWKAHNDDIPMSAVIFEQPKRIRIKQHESAVLAREAPYPGVFCIKRIKPPLSKIAFHNDLYLASNDPMEAERWMQLINYTKLKHITELLKHDHPLTPIVFKNQQQQPCSSVGPSVIESSISELECTFCGVNIHQITGNAGRHCEFCEYNTCKDCESEKGISDAVTIAHSLNHLQHPLVKLNTINNPLWYPSGHTTYTCSICKVTNELGPMYHCVECFDHDECPSCFKPIANDTVTVEVSNQNMADDTQIDIGLLSHVVTESKNVYELNKQGYRKPPQAASMITTKCWDVSQIYNVPVPSAYFEVTIHQLEGQYVSVGIGNQKFVQNQLLGYQQNSFGYCNNGQVTMNVGQNTQQFPSYAEGDTIGIGMLLDSFNTRRLYFTKNGQFLGSFSERIHVGMDCFPGVSFTPSTCQQLKFSVNLTGPFIFDTTSIADYRPMRQNLIEQLPKELIVKCLSSVAEYPQQAAELFQVSKTFASLSRNNEIWKPLFLRKWQMQNSKLRLKSWMTLYKRRVETEARVLDSMKQGTVLKYRGRPHFIENCDFEFECPLIVEDLLTDEKGNVHCNKCNKTVYKVDGQPTLEQYTAMGRCVSFYIKPKFHNVVRPQLVGVMPLPKVMAPIVQLMAPFNHTGKK